MYRYENDQLFKLNFAVFAIETLTNQNPDRYRLLYSEQKYQEKQKLLANSLKKNNPFSSNLFAYTLYIGFYKNNFYALPALIYNWHVPGIEGPQAVSTPQINPFPLSNDQTRPSSETGLSDPSRTQKQENSNSLMLIEQIDAAKETKIRNHIQIGHHKFPEKFKLPPNYIQANTKNPFFDNEDLKEVDGDDNNPKFLDLIGVKLDSDANSLKQPVCEKQGTGSILGPIRHASSLWKKFDQLMQNKYFFMLFTLLLGSLLPMFKNIYDERKRREKRVVQREIRKTVKEKGYEISNSSSSSASTSTMGDPDEDNETQSTKTTRNN